jgi:TatD family-associated radical SAM protein
MKNGKKSRAMTITYEVERGLYINLTNRCTNRCDFCIRNNADGAYGSDSLWLKREPSVDEVICAVFSHDLSKYDEIVFCGYGEPSCRLAEAVSIAKEIKAKYPDIKIRINTNGQSDLIMKRDTSSEYAVFDAVSISLNAADAKRYDEICHSVYGLDSFEAIKTFAKNVKKYVRSVMLSVVKETLSEVELLQCKKIADDCGVTLKVRTYISASDEKSE